MDTGYREYGDRSLGELFSELSTKTSTLIRQEMLLARTELAQKATDVGRDAAYLGIGGAVMYAAALGAMATLVLLLVSFGVAPWLSALIVTVVFGVAGAVLVQSHLKSLRNQQVKPVETIDSLKETAQWLKNERK